jgi:superfamily II DNA or RNA helicase
MKSSDITGNTIDGVPNDIETDTILEFDQGTLVLRGWSNEALEKILGSNPFRFDPRINALRCDAIHYQEVAKQLTQKAWRFHDTACQCKEIQWQKSDIHPPRPEQQAAIEAWLGKQRGVIVMPTGTGKTEVALHLMAQAACSTLVVAPVRDLMYQWHRRILSSFDCDAGIIGDNTFNVRPVSVTTYDSAAIHMSKLGDQFNFIIFDECHHLPGEYRREAALMSIAPLRLGLTATPERSDGRHKDLDFLIGPVVYDLPIDKVRGKTLAEFEVVRIPVVLSDSEQARYSECSATVRQFMHERRKTDSKFSWQDLCGEVGKDPEARQALLAYRHKNSIEDRAEEKLRVIEDLFRLHAGTPIIVFAGSNTMARDISIRFLIPCLLNHCGKKERLDILNGLQDGSYPAIVANQVLDEGVDVPAVKVAIVVGGTASTKQAKQRLGRILRRSGNARATLYEVVCNDTNESKRSRSRRNSDAYAGTRHRRI